MNGWSWSRVVSIGIGAVVAIWIAGPLIILLLGQFVGDPNDVGNYGSVGDMFGSSTSLFSGLGLLGVAIVLYHDMRERRKDLIDRQEARRPLLLPEIKVGGVVLTRAASVGKFSEVTLTLDLNLANATDEPALNIELEAASADGSPSLKVVVDLDNSPIAGRDSGEAEIRFDAAGDEAEAFLSAVSDADPVVVQIRVAYDNVNGVRWQSAVAYEVTSRAIDRVNLKKIRDREPGVTVGTPDTPMANGVPFEAAPVRNSWKQTRIRSLSSANDVPAEAPTASGKVRRRGRR